MTNTLIPNIIPPDIPIELLHFFERKNFKTTTLKKIGLTTGIYNFSGLIYINKGRFSISFPHSDLSTVYSFTFKPNSWFGALTFMSSPHPFLLINELEDVEVLYISNSHLTELADQNPLIYKWLLNIASHNIPKWFQIQLITLSSKQVRVIYCLVTLIAPNIKWESHIEVNVSQQQISDICGLSRPRVNEVLKDLEQKKLIELKHKKIIIKHPPTLFNLLDEANLSFYDPRQ